MKLQRRAIVAALALGVASVPAWAQAPGEPPLVAPSQSSSDVLRAGNVAATAGDWAAVAALVQPLLGGQLPPADLAEAHRLAGLAAFFAGARPDAEAHFLAYLRLDLDGQLDPALYPPEAITFFNDVKARNNAELRARRPKARRSWALTVVPYFAQAQNGERTKGIVVGTMLATFVAVNVTSFLVLRSWCTRVSGTGGSSLTCDNNQSDHYSSAPVVRGINTI